MVSDMQKDQLSMLGAIQERDLVTFIFERGKFDVIRGFVETNKVRSGCYTDRRSFVVLIIGCNPQDKALFKRFSFFFNIFFFQLYPWTYPERINFV